MADPVVPTLSDLPPVRFATPLLGVLFYWRSDPGLLPAGYRGSETRLLDAIGELTAETRRRQGRARVEYMDALTYLEAGRLGQRVHGSYESQLTLRIITMYGDNRLEDSEVAYFSKLEVLNYARSELRELRGTRHWMDLIVPRVGPMPRPGHIETNFPLKEGIHRVICVDQTARNLGAQDVDVEQLMMDAVAVQLHADLELFYETGLRRTRRCQRRACRGWYLSGPMDARSRFCSTACRVASARESARTPGRRATRRT